MARILLIYSTTDGHTLTIGKRIGAVIESHGHEVTLVPIAETDPAQLARYDRILIGARIRYGKHSPQVIEFVRRHRAALEGKPSGFYSVNVVARKPNKNTPETNPYVKKFLRLTRWRPGHLAVFAGRIDYPRYGTLDRAIIRFIMWITSGPTDPTATVDFTDWQAVEAFGHRFALADAGA
jgi:menaquinone-dependent protoporphyrinogen oxidase